MLPLFVDPPSIVILSEDFRLTRKAFCRNSRYLLPSYCQKRLEKFEKEEKIWNALKVYY